MKFSAIRKLCLCSFLVSSFILLFIFLITGIYPFGAKSILISDLSNQYIDFLSLFRRILLGEENLMYNFKIGLGSGVIPPAGYLLLSPFNVILIFFKESNIPLAIFVITVLKIGAMASSCTFLLIKASDEGGKDNNFLIVAFSTMYALMNYNIFYKQHIMWLDTLVFLPLALAETIRLKIRKNINYKLIFLISIMIITNFYTGYMACLATPFFLIYQYFKTTTKISFVDLFKILIKLLCHGIAGLILSSVFIIPMMYGLAGTSGGIEKTGYLAAVYSISDIYKSLFIGSFQTWIPDGTLPLYCGMLSLACITLLFFVKEISIKQKICVAATLLFFILSLQIRFLYLIWHGFDNPDWFEGRFIFVICLYLIFVSYQTITEHEISAITIIKVFAVINITTICFICFGKAEYSPIMLSISFGFLLSYTALLIIYKKCKMTQIILCSLVCIELLVNGIVNTHFIEQLESYEQYSEYSEVIQPLAEFVQKLNLGTFERIEKDYYRRENDAMSGSYQGMSLFSSVYNGAAHKNLRKMGVSAGEKLARYEGTTPFTDMLLGIKYIVSHEQEKPGYVYAQTYQDLNAFINPLFKSRFFVINNYDESILNGEFSTPFEYQNKIAQEFFGFEDDILEPLEIAEPQFYNVKKEEHSNLYYVEGENAYIEYNIDKKDNIIQYLYLSLATGKVNIQINGNNVSGFLGITDKIINIDDYANGVYPATIKIELESTEINVNKIKFASYDAARVEKKLFSLSGIPAVSEESSDNNIAMTVDVNDNSTLYTSIPYEDGWKAYVNGTKIASQKIMGSFVGIPLSAGNNSIQLIYMPKGLRVGIVVSLISLLLLLSFWIFEKRTEQKT